ncbi:hypothetical protein SLS61_008530 [Didymella pomorum]
MVILELSGIGRKSLLEKYGIPLVLEGPGVGENLQDHAISAQCFEVADDQISGDIMRDPNLVQAVLQQYMSTKTGLLGGMLISVTMLPLVDSKGRVSREEIARLTEHYVNQEDLPLGQKRQYEQLQRQILGPKEATGLAEHFVRPNGDEGPARTDKPKELHYDHGCQQPSILVRLLPYQATNPEDKPILDPKYLSHPLDLEILARQTQYIEMIVKTEPFASLLTPGGRSPEGREATTLEAAKEIVKESLLSTFHPVGTCTMMPRELRGVVDSRLKVHGTKNLRVVDASIFPMEILGNIQATVCAVAEKAADLIIEDWK